MQQTGKILYREFKPDLILQDYIKSYWYFYVRTDSVKSFDILPDGYFDLLVIMNDGRITDTRLTGIWNRNISISYSENTEVIGIRFKPLSIGGLFKFHIREFLNESRKIELKDFNLNGQTLLDGLNGFPGFLVSYLNKQFLKLIPLCKSDRRLKKCFELINNSTGNIKVSEVSEIIGLSSRQLHRQMSDMIGIGVKDYSKIIRFKNTMRDIKENKTNYFHYYDQSHFIREVKQYTGLTPRKLELNNNDRFIQYYDFLS